MKSSFILLPFIALLLLTNAQDCNNPLLQVFNLEALDSPVQGGDLPFCGNLQGDGQTCCSAETIQSFQERLNTLTQSIQTLAGERDVYITEIFANYTHQYQQVADDLSDFDGEVRRIQRENSTLGKALGAQAGFLYRLDRELDRIDDRFTTAFREYQEDRQACFTTLLEVQANAWCLACDANYASFFNDDGNVNASPDICNAIQASCAPFLVKSDYLNPLYQAQQSFSRLESVIEYLRNYTNNNNVLPDTQIIDDQWEETDPAKRTSSLPEGCTEDSCEWLCSNLFSNQFVLNQELAANGAGITGGDDVRFAPIPLIIPPSGGSRLLQEVEFWNPDLGSTGLEFDVIADPANAQALLPPNDDTDNTDDHITDDTDSEPDWTDTTDTTDNDPTDWTDTERTNPPTTNRLIGQKFFVGKNN